MRHTFLVGIVVLASLAGCKGGGTGTSVDKPASGGRVSNSQEPAYSKQEVLEKLGLTSQGDLGREECVASVILTTPKEIELYAGLGDTVATNDAGTVGVKVGTYQGSPSMAECARRFAKLLSEGLP